MKRKKSKLLICISLFMVSSILLWPSMFKAHFNDDNMDIKYSSFDYLIIADNEYSKTSTSSSYYNESSTFSSYYFGAVANQNYIALSTSSTLQIDNGLDDGTESSIISEKSCKEAFGDEFINYFKVIYKIIALLIPLIVIVLSMLDFTKFTTNEEEIKKPIKKLATRCVLLVFLYLLPSLLTFIGNLLGFDISCMF